MNNNINDKLNKLYMQKNHIIQNNKDDDNYDDQLSYVEKEIENLEYQKKFNNLKNNHIINNNRKLYVYKGPIYEFNNKIGDSEIYRTHAINEKQAINNITFKIKKDLKKEKNTRITIDKNFLKVNE